MRYANYERRMLWTYTLLKQIIKYRKILIAIASFSFLMMSSYSITKGMVYDVSVPDVVTFGDSYVIESKSFFSHVSYEYRMVGEDTWNDELPLRTGEYEVKITTTRLFGQKKETIYDFQIQSKEVELTLESSDIQFGDEPQVIAQLYEGDYIDSVEFAYGDLSQNETSLDLENIVVKDQNGVDVTNSYQFHFQTSIIRFIPRIISVQPANESKVYDGEALQTNEALIISGSLLEGHTILITTSGSQTNVGSSSNTILSATIWDGDVDVSENYEISFGAGNLEVTPRPITIQTSDGEKTYDGSALINEDYQVIDGEIVEGQTLSVISNSAIIDAGEQPNALDFSVFDGMTNKTENYEITILTGTLSVLPRPITIETFSDERTYDGESLWNEGYLIREGNLVLGQNIFVVSHTIQTEAGETPNELGISILEGINDYTRNYDITFVTGTLKVTPRTIWIQPVIQSKIYDGSALQSSEVEVYGETALIVGHSIIALTEGSQTYVGSSLNIILSATVWDGDNEVTQNYQLNFSENSLTVTPRQITIDTASAQKIYDGLPLWSEDYQITQGHLVDGQSISVTSYSQIINFGETLNTLEISIFDGTFDMTSNYDIQINKGILTILQKSIVIRPTYLTKEYDGTPLSSSEAETIGINELVIGQHIVAQTTGSRTTVGEASNTILNSKIFDGEIDVSNNYIITYQEGLLRVTPRPITFTTATGAKIYDGSPFWNENYQISLGSIVDGHSIIVTLNTQITNAGNTPNVLEVAIYDGTTDMTDNYAITYLSGTLTITPRPITLETATDEQIYDGTSLWNEGVQIISGSLVGTNTIQVTTHSTITNVGVISNTLGISIYDGGTNNTMNYAITFVKGTLTVSYREITIQTSNDEKIYDGTPLWNEGWLISDGTLAAGQSIDILSNSQLTNVGNMPNTLGISIVSGLGDVTSNYAITMDAGTLSVTPRPITILTISDTKTYDGTPLWNEGYQITSGSLVIHQAITITSNTKITNVGDSLNTLVVSIYDGMTDLTGNYDITYIRGTLSVTPRPIEIQPTIQTRIYDGTPLVSNLVEVISPLNLVLEHFIIATTSGSQTNVGSSSNIILAATIYNGDEDVTSNYDLSFAEGSLVITPRPIVIQPTFQTKIYDGTSLTSTEVSTIGNYELVGDHHIHAITSGSQTNVGSSSNILLSATIWDGENDVTYNYEMTFFEGVLEVTRRPITIETAGAEKIYDGIALVNDDFEIIDGSLAFGQSIFAISFPQITNVGEILNSLGFAIYDGGLETTENYIITYIKGTLKVTPRPITIETATDTKIYDGTPLWNETTTLIDGSIVDGQSISVLSNTQITNVGQISNHLDVSIMDGFNDLTYNYDITFVEGVLYVTPRSITILTASDEKVYDGTSLRNEGVQVIGGSLIGSQVISITSNTSILNVGETPNTLGISIVDGLIDMTDNYEIIVEKGTLRITPRPITILTATDEKHYDGTPLWNEGVHVLSGSLVNEQFISISSHSSITTVGEIQNTLEMSIFEGTTDVTGNYLITLVKGTLKITPRPITIETASDDKIYDKTPLNNEGYLVIEGSLVGEQTILVTSHTEIINAGEIENTLSVSIFDGLTDMSQNYDITFVKGILTIIPKTIKISTPSASKAYDGTPLTALDWELTDSELLEGDFLSVNVIGTITAVGKVFNKFEYEIKDENDIDVSSNYLVAPNIGILEVVENREVISITSGTDSKAYDGEPLTKDEWWISAGSLLPGHTISVTVTGEIVEVGEIPNGFTYTIYDELGADVTNLYAVKEVYGTLTIFGDDGNGDTTNSGTSISNEGSFDGVASVMFQIYSSITDTIYLRAKSYGEYTKTGWSAPQVYESPYGVSPFLFPFLNSPADIEVGNAQIKAMISGLPYFLPYYPASGLYDNINDVYANYSYGIGYNNQFIPTRALNESAISLFGTPAEVYELEYRIFVYDYYMQLPESTKNAMLEIAGLNGLDPQSETIIQDVQNYITSAAIYNKSFKPIPSNADFAVYFLTESREGICQHFAMAATVMFRALGIPARYVTGFVADATANEWTDVTSDRAHAWVEIYIDGFGWVPIEVTPGGAGGGAGGSSGGGGGTGGGTSDPGEGDGSGSGGSSIVGSNPDDETLETIDIISGDSSKVYDGTPLTDHTYTTVGSLQEGHTIVVEMNCSITQVGQIRNEFNAVIFDESGNDVSDLYNIRKVYGWLVVVPNNGLEIIEIKLFDNVSIYDGTIHTLGAEDYWIPSKNLPAGYHIYLDIIGDTLNVDKVIAAIDRTTIRIVDENMMDVTQNYNIVFYDGSVEVIKRAITICLVNVIQYYDGLPLTSDAYYLSVGTLVEGDTVILTVDGSITDVGTVWNYITNVQILNADGEDVTSNYSLRTVKGLLTVLPE